MSASPVFGAIRAAPLAVLALNAWGCGGPATDPLEDVRAEIPELLDAYDVPSIAVAVAIGGEIVWEEGFGWADREAGTPATEHTLYSLASISKPITATGLMTLVEAHRVDLHAPIDEYLGDAKLNGRAFDAWGATVRRVASHTAGLPLHYQFFYEDEPYRRPPMDETIRRYGNLVTAPGERYQYSNLGFGIIDYVMTRVSGLSYPEFMTERVFGPLGMTHTSVDVAPGLEDFAAARYATDGSRIPFYDFDHPGASAVWSSAHDLVRFGMFHLKDHLPDQEPILTDASIDLMHRPVADTGVGSSYGLGWATRTWESGFRTFSHTGGMGGVRTSLNIVPDRDIAVVVLLNSSSAVMGYLTDRILASLAPGDVPNPDRPPLEVASDEEEDPPFQAPDSLTGVWMGSVDTYMGARDLRVVVDPAAVRVRLGMQPIQDLDGASFDGSYLRGRFSGDLGTEDVRRTDHVVAVELRLRGSVMNGSLIGLSVPAVRVGNALTHWAEVRRAR